MPELRWARSSVPWLLAALLVVLGACDRTTAPSEEPATVTPSETARCVGERLEQSGIDGRVVDPDGNPLGDIFILIEAADGFRGDTRTAGDGVFTAPSVTGEFTISTVDVDFTSAPQRITVVCGETATIEIVMTPVED